MIRLNQAMDYAKHRLWTTRKEDLARQAAKQQSKETSKDEHCFGPKKKKSRFKFEQEEKRLRKVSGKINRINRLFDIFLHYKSICYK